jgi:hypothetical protein
MGVEPGSGGRASDAQPAQSLAGPADALGVALDRSGVGGELLTEAHGHRVLQMGPAGFDHRVEGHRPLLQGAG